MSRPRVLILFADEWLAYSPTVLCLADLLQSSFDLRIVAFDANVGPRLDQYAIRYLPLGNGLRFFGVRFKRWLERWPLMVRRYRQWKKRRLAKAMRDEAADHVIAVGPLALEVARQKFARVHYLSMEINFPSLSAMDLRSICLVLSQSRDRFESVFKGAGLPLLLLPNAPRARAHSPDSRRRGDFLFLGFAEFSRGLMPALNVLTWDPSYRLTIKGFISPSIERLLRREFAKELSAGRLILDTRYESMIGLTEYAARFYASFCFYDLSVVPPDQLDEYRSSPSGRMHQSFASAVPVLANQLPAFEPVREFGAGVLAPSIDRPALQAALAELDRNYQAYCEGAATAGAHYDFDRWAKPFVEHLEHCQCQKNSV